MRSIDQMAPGSLLYWGSRIFVEEFVRWLREWWRIVQMDRPHYEDNEDNIIWKFDQQETLDKWIVSKDSDWGEGYSTANWERSPAGHALYHGFLDTKTFPKDRTITRVGWTAVSCPPAVASFMREGRYEWQEFTHMVLRVRGDGRTYAISMRTPGSFNLTYFDTYTYGLYTTGGPYWQYVRIPFSRFVFTARGSVQDFQEPIELHNVLSFSIGCMDRIHGPFRLEIDYIALQFDPTWMEENQYEMYYIPQHKYVGP